MSLGPLHQILFEQMEQRERASFINSLGGHKSVHLVGTYSPSLNQENLAIISSCFHLGANPALMGMIIRPHETERHTFEYILETNSYTLNHVHPDFFHAAHQTSARYPREISEFAACGLTPFYEEGHIAPFVKESRVRVGMKLRDHQTLSINKTELLIGEIVLVQAPFELISADGSLNLHQAQSVGVCGLDRYHSARPLARLSYAKPDKRPQEIDDRYPAPLQWRGRPISL